MYSMDFPGLFIGKNFSMDSLMSNKLVIYLYNLKITYSRIKAIFRVRPLFGELYQCMFYFSPTIHWALLCSHTPTLKCVQLQKKIVIFKSLCTRVTYIAQNFDTVMLHLVISNIQRTSGWNFHLNFSLWIQVTEFK